MKKFQDIQNTKKDPSENKLSSLNVIDKYQQDKHKTTEEIVFTSKEALLSKKIISNKSAKAVLSDLASRSIRGETFTSANDYLKQINVEKPITSNKDEVGPQTSQDNIQTLILKDDTRVTLRSICPDDSQLMDNFFDMLSPESIRFRFGTMGRTPNLEYLKKICSNDYSQDVILTTRNQQDQIIGIAQLVKDRKGENRADLDFVIADKYQGKGLGSKLLDQCIQIARDKGLQRITGQVEEDNIVMTKMFEKRGFCITPIPEDEVIEATLELKPISSSSKSFLGRLLKNWPD